MACDLCFVRPLVINSKELELVRQVKTIGIIISSDLKWNCHVFFGAA